MVERRTEDPRAAGSTPAPAANNFSMPEWRNWHTQATQNRRDYVPEGSSPSFGTIFIFAGMTELVYESDLKSDGLLPVPVRVRLPAPFSSRSSAGSEHAATDRRVKGSNPFGRAILAGVAQLTERLPCKQRVRGLNPRSGSTDC